MVSCLLSFHIAVRCGSALRLWLHICTDQEYENNYFLFLVFFQFEHLVAPPQMEQNAGHVQKPPRTPEN